MGVQECITWIFIGKVFRQGGVLGVGGECPDVIYPPGSIVCELWVVAGFVGWFASGSSDPGGSVILSYNWAIVTPFLCILYNSPPLTFFYVFLFGSCCTFAVALGKVSFLLFSRRGRGRELWRNVRAYLTSCPPLLIFIMLTDSNQIFRNCFVIIYCHLTKVSSQINKCIIFEHNELSITLSTMWWDCLLLALPS